MYVEISRQIGAFPLSENLFGGQDVFDPPSKLFHGERFGQYMHSGPQMAVSDHGVLSVPRDKEHFQVALCPLVYPRCCVCRLRRLDYLERISAAARGQKYHH
jgi:hypothetical protein